jgi:hypothetical protein
MIKNSKKKKIEMNGKNEGKRNQDGRRKKKS